MKFHGNFIGEDKPDVVLDFLGGDSEELLVEHLKTQPDDWYYRTNSLTYNINHLGHRCKNINEIDLDNYILFAGCSHTAGIGLELEKTYPYIVSKKIGVDYYNLALGATGIDTVEYNVLSWLFTISKPPKAIVLQLPDHSRFLNKNENYDRLLPYGSWTADSNCSKFIVNAEDSGFFNARKKLALSLIESVAKCPVHKIVYGNQSGYDIKSLYMRGIDKARDMSHSGIQSHQEFSEVLVSAILADK
jgi:hypothetical protein